MAIDATTIAGLLAGQPPCSTCGLAATRHGPPSPGISAHPDDVVPMLERRYCDDCAPPGAEDLDNARAIRMAKAYLLELQGTPPPAPVPDHAPVAVPDARGRLGRDLRRIARAALGLSSHAVTAAPARLSARLLFLGQRVEAELVVPAIAATVRLAAKIDGGPAPRAATHEQLVAVLSERKAAGRSS